MDRNQTFSSDGPPHCVAQNMYGTSGCRCYPRSSRPMKERDRVMIRGGEGPFRSIRTGSTTERLRNPRRFPSGKRCSVTHHHERSIESSFFPSQPDPGSDHEVARKSDVALHRLKLKMVPMLNRGTRNCCHHPGQSWIAIPPPPITRNGPACRAKGPLQAMRAARQAGDLPHDRGGGEGRDLPGGHQ